MTDPVQPLHCPAALRTLPGWLVWRYAPNPVAGKPPLKLPCYADEAGGPRQGRQGSAQDRARLVSFDEALARAREHGFEGVGLALLPEFGVAALDFDHCVAGGQVAPEVEQLVAGTYAELSPSGQGVRAFVRAAPDVLGNHKSPAAAGVWGFETFSSSGFVTFTGRQLPASALVAGPDFIAPAGQGVRELAAARFHLPGRQADGAPGDDFLMLHEPPVGLLPAQIDEALAALDPDCGYEQWIQLDGGRRLRSLGRLERPGRQVPGARAAAGALGGLWKRRLPPGDCALPAENRPRGRREGRPARRCRRAFAGGRKL